MDTSPNKRAEPGIYVQASFYVQSQINRKDL